MIRVTCPACQFTRDYPDHLAGWELACRGCAALVLVGGPDAEHISDDVAAVRPAPAAVRFVAGVVGGVCWLVGAVAAFAVVVFFDWLLHGETSKVKAAGLLVSAVVAVVFLGLSRLLLPVMSPERAGKADAGRATGV